MWRGDVRIQRTGRPLKSRLPGAGGSPFGWAELAVVPLILILSVPPLLWFGHHWVVSGNDTARYLLAGSQLITGGASENLDTISEFNGGHGPGFPSLFAFLIPIFRRGTGTFVLGFRPVSLLNPPFGFFF